MSGMRDRLRKHLFGELIPLPAADWPEDQADLFEIGLDSVRIMRLLVFIEEELGVRIPEEAIDPERIARVGGLLTLIAEHRS